MADALIRPCFLFFFSPTPKTPSTPCDAHTLSHTTHPNNTTQHNTTNKGTGQKDAALLLEAMLSDPADFVRQGAAVALALVLMQQPEARVAPLRKRLMASIADKHEETLARMGAITAAGILDAGGRNATVGLRSRSGYFRRTSVVGLALFCQVCVVWFFCVGVLLFFVVVCLSV